jgi:hypothetical protein
MAMSATTNSAIVPSARSTRPLSRSVGIGTGRRCDTFLARPYTSGELVDTIARLLPG